MTEEREFDPTLNMFLLIVLALILAWVVKNWLIGILRTIAHVG